MVSIFSDVSDFAPEPVEPKTASHVALGAASPLWLMFGGAAAAGATWWWWASRWREAVNVEALLAIAPEPATVPAETLATLQTTPAPAVEAAALVADAAGTVLDGVQDAAEAVGQPLVQNAAAMAEQAAQAVVEPAAAIEPAITQAAETAADQVAETAPLAVEVLETMQEAAEAGLDDLTRLIGVGPKLAASLGDLGVTRFSQIAAWTPDELASFDQLLNLKGRADREAWIAQAQRLANEATS